jgi:thiol-disulfide isomerase/thioredoxin
MRKIVAILLILVLLTTMAALTGCSLPGKSDAEPTLAVTTPTSTPEADVTPGEATPTTAPDRFPDRANADTGKGSPKELSENDVAPEFSLAMYDGTKFRISEHDDEVVLLNFWATWCGPCVSEMPDLMKLAKENIPGFTIRFISIGDDAATVAQFIAENGYDKSLIGCADGTRISEYYPCDYIPYTVIVVNGIVRETLIGSRSYNDYKSVLGKYTGK